MYTDEKENAATVNYLKNRDAAGEEPFTEVVSKAKKKRVFRFIISASGRKFG
jgi:hypothetical protein